LKFVRSLVPALLLAGCAAPVPVAAPPPPPPSAAAPAAPPAPPAVPAFTEQQTTPRRPVADTLAQGRAVVSAADVRASEAGTAMLARGGSAADAAAATMIALTVVEPQSSGIGGGGFLVYHDAATGALITLDGREKAPASAGPGLFVGPDGKPLPRGQAVPGGKSVGVPGNVRLAAELHRRHGKLPWAALFDPAIRLADDGFVVTERLHEAIEREAGDLSPAARALYLGADGKPLPIGARLRNPALADTLRRVAEGGPDAFYKGPIAEKIVAAVRDAARNPAGMTTADLARYSVAERAPLCGTYRSYRICGMGPPSSGGIAVLQILKQLERFDLAALGPDNPLAWHLFAESSRLAFADREAWVADPAFAKVPVAGLLDPTYLSQRSALIRLEAAMPAVAPGRPPGAADAPVAAVVREVPSTSHMVAADARGNVASLTSTVEGTFGSGLVAAGFVLNNELTDFDLSPTKDGRPVPNRVEPGKRPRSSMAPTLVYGPDGRVVAALGAAGGPTIISQVAKTLIGLIDWKRPIGEAIDLPNLYASGRTFTFEGGTRLEGMAATFRSLGHAGAQGRLNIGKANGVERTAAGWRGAADTRSEGEAAAAR